MNIETGEVITDEQYQKLTEEEKKKYIKEAIGRVITMQETEEFSAKCINGGYKPTQQELKDHSENLRKLVAKSHNISESQVEGYLRTKNQMRNNSQHPTKIGRNEPCPCGSGKKYKYCHLKA